MPGVMSESWALRRLCAAFIVGTESPYVKTSNEGSRLLDGHIPAAALEVAGKVFSDRGIPPATGSRF